jgi:hypothetical protein
MKKRVKRYDGEEGSVVESDMPAQRIEFSENTGSTGPTRDMSFKEAFASARGAGNKTFEWQGKKYTTELASPKSSRAAESAPKSARISESASKSVAKINSASAPMARSIKSDLDELARAKSAIETVNAMPKGRMLPQAKEEFLTPTPKRSGYTMPKASEFTGMGSMKFAGGGKVRSASARADGIAIRGKTRA